MPFQLSSFPTGFLSLLGSQNFGETPRQYSETIVPTVEMGELFLLTKQEPIVGSFAPLVGGVNLANQLTVPAGELWRVLAASMFVSAGVGVTGVVTPVYLQGPSTYSLALADSTVFVASTDRHTVGKFQPFWAPAGARIAADATAIVGAPTASISVLISRLRA